MKLKLKVYGEEDEKDDMSFSFFFPQYIKKPKKNLGIKIWQRLELDGGKLKKKEQRGEKYINLDKDTNGGWGLGRVLKVLISCE